MENMIQILSEPPVAKEQETSEDAIFGEMIVQMLSAIPESEEKWFLKLKIQ